VTPTLTALLLRTRGGAAGILPGTPIEWTPDHVLLDDDHGTVAALTFEAAGATRIACESAVFIPQRDSTGPDDLADLRYLQTFASATGARFVRPGAGTASAVYRRRFALPGRVLASSVPGAGAAGALGMLVLSASALECGAAMAGEPLLTERPRVIGVAFEGVLDPGVTGHDVLLALERRLGGEANGAVLECRGVGLASLRMADRFALAAHAPTVTGARALLLPSDDRTRGWFRAMGRDADWRRLEGPDAGFDEELMLDLARVRPERATGTRVRLGPFVDDEDVLGLARALAARERALLLPLEVVVPGRLELALWSDAGALDALRAVGRRSSIAPTRRSRPSRRTCSWSAVSRDSGSSRSVASGPRPRHSPDVPRPRTCSRRMTRGRWRRPSGPTSSNPRAVTSNAVRIIGRASRRRVTTRPIARWRSSTSGMTRARRVSCPGVHACGRCAPMPRNCPRRCCDRSIPRRPRVRVRSGPRCSSRGTLRRRGAFRGGGARGGRPRRARGGRHLVCLTGATGCSRSMACCRSSGSTPRIVVRSERGMNSRSRPGPRHAPGGRVPLRHLTRGFTFDVRCDLVLPLRESARARGLLHAMRDTVADVAR
jgi:hypothetical protein